MSSFFSELQIKVLGEGEDRPEHTIPIDIVYHKLVEWLVDRKTCPVDWRRQMETVRESAKKAISSLPNTPEFSEFRKLCEETNPTFFEFEEVFGRLKEHADHGKTDFLGRYSSPLTSSFYTIVSSWKKNNLFLADSASFLVRAVQFDIPSIRSEILRLTKQSSEWARKEAEHERTAAKYLSEFKDSCSKWGILEANIQEGLSEVVERELPLFFERATLFVKENAKSLEETIDFYSSFGHYTLEGEAASHSLSCLCPLLQFWIRFGNRKSIEWTKFSSGESEWQSIEEIVEKIEDVPQSGQDDAVVPILDLSIDPNDTVNFDFSSDLNVYGPSGLSELSVDGVAIDWTVSDSSASSEGSSAPSINWDVTDGDAPNIEIVDAAEVGIGEFGDMNAEKKANEKERETILSSNETRRTLLSELLELEIFLSQRLVEMKAKDTLLASNQFQFASAIVQRQTISSVEAFLQSVTRVLKLFNEERVRLLFEMKSSRHFVDRMTASIRQKKDAANKLSMGILELQAKQAAYAADVASKRPVVDEVIQRVKKTQKSIESSLSSVYRRPVHIIGEINSL